MASYLGRPRQGNGSCRFCKEPFCQCGAPPRSKWRYPLFVSHSAARDVGLPRAPGTLRLLLRIDVQHDPGDVSPVSVLCSGIEQAEIGDEVLFVVARQDSLCGRDVVDWRVEWRGLHRCRDLADWCCDYGTPAS